MTFAAETWSGRLVDANCSSQEKTAKECDANAATASFMLVVDGKAFALDEAGNKKATEALRSRADRSTDPNALKSAQTVAKVTGEKEGATIKVSSLEVE
jgi:hypothetical protein